MADHLTAGRRGNAEVAIQEEVAQAPSREFGIAWFDVRKCVDDSVLIHRGLHCSRSSKSRRSLTSNFSAARIGVFAATWCYAKITPAALHRGDFACRGRKDREVSGRHSKFAMSYFRRVVAASAAPLTPGPGWQQVKHHLPGA
jgi:hypothetical protein